MKKKDNGLRWYICGVLVSFIFVTYGLYGCIRNSLGSADANEVSSSVPEITTQDDAGYTPAGNVYAKIDGFDGMNLCADTYTQTVDFYNDSSNPCDMIISIYLADGTVIYTSGIISPGERVTEADFCETLSAGLYDNAIFVYDLCSIDNNEILSRCEMRIELSVK